MGVCFGREYSSFKPELEEIKGKRERFIEILKMRGTNHSKDTRIFEIKKGIKIGRKVNLKK